MTRREHDENGVRRNGRFARFLPALFALVLASGGLFVPGMSGPVFAQERPRTIFDLLFRPFEKSKPAVKSPRTEPAKKKSVTRRKSDAATLASQGTDSQAVVEKVDSARVVLVVGDFVAGGLADGLVAAFATNASVRVVDRSNGSSGFVRDDFYNWPGEIGAIIAEVKPAVVVAMIGANDRQQMKIGTTREQPLTDTWTKEYSSRATAFAEAVRKAGVPLIWIGQPSFKPTSMANGMTALNDVFSAVTEKSGATFVDIWDGFVDENGAFVTTGPDINGQPVRLRTNDGINLTAAGRRKIAFYAEKPLAKLLGTGSATPAYAPAVPLPGEPVAAAPVLDRTAPISLNDPALDGGGELLGVVTTPPSTPALPGVPTDRSGRADDFSAPAILSRSTERPEPEKTATR